MNNSVNISFAQSQAGYKSTLLIAGVDSQMNNASAFDNMPGEDQAPEVGTVLSDAQDSYVKLDYDPETGEAQKFSFEARQNMVAPNGQLVTPQGKKTTYTRSDDGTQKYEQQEPTTDGRVYHQEAVVNPKTETISFNEWIVAPQ